MSEPSTVNKTASIVNQILSGLINGAGADALEAAVIVEVPWLGLPFVKQIFHFIVGKISAAIYRQAALAATAIIIDVQINQEEGSANSAFQNLLAADASGDPLAIAQASKDLSAKYGALIHFDGSASP